MDHDGSVSHLEAANSWSLNGLIYKYPSVEAADSSIYKSNLAVQTCSPALLLQKIPSQITPFNSWK